MMIENTSLIRSKPHQFMHLEKPSFPINTIRACVLSLAVAFSMEAIAAINPAAAAVAPVPVKNGVVQPRRPLPEALCDAMQFLKRADGGYLPGRIDGELAGYFTSAFVNPDGSRSERPMAFPGRHHAYFINTFLLYHNYTGQREWLLRARDLADWNLLHSTPPQAVYSNFPYSTWSRGQPGGSRDVDAIEPDKSAFLATSYLALHKATGDAKYLRGARAVADTLAATQRDDGSWPFRVKPEDGIVRQEFGGAPVFYVDSFERLLGYANEPAYRRTYERTLKLMLKRNVEENLWGTYHEDIVLKPNDYLSAEPMSFTAEYLFRRAGDHPEYVEMGRKILRALEERLVHTQGHAAAPAPAVSEQAGFDHIMPGHTARYCVALARLYSVTGDETAKRRALSGFNAVTYMQSEVGLFRTFFHSVRPNAKNVNRPDWYSQHLYTVCHVLEAAPLLPELGIKPERRN